MKLSTALCVYVLCVCSLIFGGITCVLEYSATDRQVDEAGRITGLMQTRMLSAVDGRLRQVEQDVRNVASIVGSRSGNLKDSGADRMLHYLIRSDSLMTGVSLAYNPGALPLHKDPWMLYVKREKDSLSVSQLYGTGYDYLDADWFAECVKTGDTRWSTPYFDKGGGDCIMTTFSYPLSDGNGDVYAVLTADVALDSLFRYVASLRPYDGSRTFVTDKSGNEISIAAPTVDDDTDGSDLPHSVRQAAVDALKRAGNENVRILEHDGRKYLANYASLPHRDAVICTVTPYNEVAVTMRSLKLPLILVVGGGFLLLMAGILLVFRFGSRPLRKLTEAAENIASGDFNTPLPESMRFADLDRLRDAMQKMEVSISDHVAKRAEQIAEQRRIKDELETAASIQRYMLPDLEAFVNPSLEVAGMLRAALEVSGDLYDILTCGNKTYFIIADVSGKGVPASLVMSEVRSMFRFAASESLSPSDILTRINRHLAEGNAGCMFVTAIAGVVDTESGRVALANAGHTSPVLVGDTPQLLSLPVALPLGVMDDTVYGESLFEIGDRSLLLYTDGITEAEDSDGIQFGTSRIMDVLGSLTSGERAPSEVVGLLAEKVMAFSDGKQSDDITMLCIRILTLSDSISLAYDTAQLASLSEFVNKFGEKMGWDSQKVMNVNIALEEAVSNVMLHSARPLPEAEIEVMLQQSAGIVKAIVTDSGKMFNPVVWNMPDHLQADVEERPVGGLGIYMIRKLSRNISFEYKNRKNILTITF